MAPKPATEVQEVRTLREAAIVISFLQEGMSEVREELRGIGRMSTTTMLSMLGVVAYIVVSKVIGG